MHEQFNITKIQSPLVVVIESGTLLANDLYSVNEVKFEIAKIESYTEWCNDHLRPALFALQNLTAKNIERRFADMCEEYAKRMGKPLGDGARDHLRFSFHKVTVARLRVFTNHHGDPGYMFDDEKAPRWSIPFSSFRPDLMVPTRPTDYDNAVWAELKERVARAAKQQT